MYDIDVMWHTHIVYPKAYAKDMMSILGYIMTHDTDQGREDGSKLNTVIIISAFSQRYA